MRVCLFFFLDMYLSKKDKSCKTISFISWVKDFGYFNASLRNRWNSMYDIRFLATSLSNWYISTRLFCLVASRLSNCSDGFYSGNIFRYKRQIQKSYKYNQIGYTELLSPESNYFCFLVFYIIGHTQKVWLYDCYMYWL